MDRLNAHYAKSALAIALAAVLFVGTFAAMPLLSGKAFAQAAVSITTSADKNNNKFFENGIVEVRINDAALAANSGFQQGTVTVNAFGTSSSFQVDETDGTSGMLLIYLKVDPDDVANVDLPAFPANALSAKFTNLIIGPGPGPLSASYDNGIAGSTERSIIVTPSEGGTVSVTYGGVTKTITFDDTPATLTLDRSHYGGLSKIYAVIYDPEMDLDPTSINTYNETAQGPLISGVDHVNGILSETGVDSAKLELVLTSGALGAGLETESRSLTAKDFKNFVGGASGAVLQNAGTQQGTSSASYVVEQIRGSIQPLGTTTYSSELPLSVSDPDENKDSKATNQLAGALKLIVSGDPDRTFALTESSQNSGSFVPTTNGGKIKLTFKQATDEALGIFRVEPTTSVEARYIDPDLVATSTRTFSLANIAPALTLDKSTAGAASTVKLTLNDADLNDDSGVIESYTATYTAGTSTTHTQGLVTFVGSGGFDAFSLEIRKNGETVTIDALKTLSVTFIETGANTGIFEANVRLDTLNADVIAAHKLADSDTLKFEIQDDLTTAVSKPKTSATVTIGIEKPSMKVDRQTAGVPRDPAKDDIAVTGFVSDDVSNLGDAIVRLTLTDPAANTNNLSEETLLAAAAATNATGNVWTSADGKWTITFTPGSTAQFGGTPRVSVIDPIKETGSDTGIFTGTFGIDATLTDRPAWIGAKGKIEYNSVGDDPSPTTVTFTARSASLTTDTVLIVTGGKVTVTVRDADSNIDTTSAEQVKVQFEWDDSTAVPSSKTEFLTLDETGDDTGVFTATVNVGTDTIDSTTFKPKPDTDVTLTYFDLTPSMSSTASGWLSASNTNVQIEKTLNSGSNAGALSIGGATKIGPSTKLQVIVVDNDLNTNPNSKDDTGSKITIVTDRGVSVEMSASESEANSGRFTGDLSLEPSSETTATGDGTDDVTIPVLPGDVISVRYQDDKGANGQKTTVSKTVEVTSVDPEIKTDRTEYGPNDQITLTVADLDADKDPDSNDIKNVRVTSTTDAVGLTSVQLIETGSSTGVFSGTVQLASTFSTGSLQVSPGDTVQIKYTDDFPADYKTRLDNGGTLTKDFLATVKIGGASVKGGTTSSTTPSAPSLTDINGKPLTDVAAGSQVLLSTTIKNNEADARTFTAIIDVRDSTGQTISLQFQTGTLAGNEQKSIGASWTPSDAGSYKVGTFVLSELGTTATILSPKVESTVTVS